jgi:hypothetical protein
MWAYTLHLLTASSDGIAVPQVFCSIIDLRASAEVITHVLCSQPKWCITLGYVAV